MLKKRIIPKILITRKNEQWRAVVTKKFNNEQMVATPLSLAKIYQSQQADELFFCNKDIAKGSLLQALDILQNASSELLLPLTYGGQIRCIKDMELLFANGADKISVNSLLFTNPMIVKEAVELFGTANITACLDYIEDEGLCVYCGGKEVSEKTLADMLPFVEQLGVGEIVVNCVSKDGTGLGFDECSIKATKGLKVPTIISGGAGKVSDFIHVLKSKHIDGVIAGTFFTKQDQNIHQVRSQIRNAGISLRLSS